MAKKKAKPPRRTKGRHHAGWKGQLRCGLVSFGVQAYNAAIPERGEFHFHQLHAACHSRIHYAKVCPIHGEVPQDEIISGYEIKRGEYVEIEPNELEDMRAQGERALTIHEFIVPEELDAMFYDGRMYYLLPDSELASEAYAVLQAAMKHQGRDGIGQVMFSGREQMVRLLAVDRMLVMALLHYSAELKHPAEVEKGLSAARPPKKSVDLAVKLIESFASKDFDFSDYQDDYRERMKELIDAKREGRDVAAPEEEEMPATLNLMDALRKSLDRGRQVSAKHPHRKPHSKRASGRRRAS